MTPLPTVDMALAEARERLRGAGIETAALDARVLAAHALDASIEALIRNGGERITAQAFGRLGEAVARRADREPVAYITGRREFWSLEFAVGPGCLIPRPDSEALVSAVLQAAGEATEALRLLDLGTGSGCLLLALLNELPRATGTGVDRDGRAVGMARTNAGRLGLEDRAAFVQGDWAAALSGPFDVIIANPPYIPTADIGELSPDVRDFEPLPALDGGEDGLEAIRALLARIGRILAPQGLVAVEFGPGQAPAVEALAREAAGLYRQQLISDLAGRTRGILLRPGPP